MLDHDFKRINNLSKMMLLLSISPFLFDSSKEVPSKTLFQTPEDSSSLAGGPFSISYFPQDKIQISKTFKIIVWEER